MRALEKIDRVIFVVVFLTVTIAAAAVLWDALGRSPGKLTFDASMSLKDISDANGVPRRQILHQLSHENRDVWDWPRNVAVSEWPIDPARVKDALEHSLFESAPLKELIKISLWSVFVAVAATVLLKTRRIRRMRYQLLGGSVILFGIILGATPNPMESVVKFFKWTNGMESGGVEKTVILAAFFLLAIVVNKGICGWGCQLGALQDMAHGSHLSPRGLRWRPPFWLSNGVRIIFFGVFICLLYGLLFGIDNFVVYHHINYFKIFNADLAPFAYAGLAVFFVVILLVYRPFCQFVCPFGLLSWLAERLSIYKVRIDRSKCTDCLACTKACPTFAMKARYEGKCGPRLPDCWACGACVEACPEDAIVFDRKRPSASPVTAEQ
jgi:polyferredoxin